MAREFASSNAENFVGICLIQVGLKNAGVLAQAAFHDGFVAFLRIVPAGLQDFLRLGSLRKNHEARGLLVQTVHDPNPRAGHRVATAHMVGELMVSRPLLFRLAGNAEEVRRLVDDDNVRILKKYTNARADQRARRGIAIIPHRDNISRLERVIELRDRAPIHSDRLKFQPSANLLFLQVRPDLETIRQQLGRTGNSRRLGHRQNRSKAACLGKRIRASAF